MSINTSSSTMALACTKVPRVHESILVGLLYNELPQNIAVHLISSLIA